MGGVTRTQAFLIVPALLAAGLTGYVVRGGEETGTSAQADRAKPRALRACPARAWAQGGGSDYAVSGMSCHEANQFIRTGMTYQPGVHQEGRALRFHDWVCFQRATGPRNSGTLNICANGKSRLRFLMQG